jgi:hypothetical protein
MLPTLTASLLLALLLLLLQQLLPCTLLLLVAVPQCAQRRLAVTVQIICGCVTSICMVMVAAEATVPVFPITAAAAGQGPPSTASPSTARPAATSHQRLLNALSKQLLVHFVPRLLLPLPAAAAALAGATWG